MGGIKWSYNRYDKEVRFFVIPYLAKLKIRNSFF